jgi:hypothetical protein
MELFLKCLDDVDDLFARLAQRFQPLLGTLVFTIVVVGAATAFLLFAPNPLLAAP